MIKFKLLFLACLTCLVQLGAAQSIKNGAEQMETLLPLLKGKNVALVVNHTSKCGDKHLLDTLINAGIRIQKVFAPEHGFRGNADAGEVIANGKDIKTGVSIVSLYGSNKKPKPEQMQDIDIVVFDIQDVGSRFYTYISTMHYVMEACAENNKPLIVADRPNPCDYIDGPIRQENLKTFVSMDPIPVLHGCTVGELAKMINGEGWLKNKVSCKLTVIPVKGWKHGDAYSIPVKPSPNLPNDQAIALYASLCPFEGTSVSVGRGTFTPFQILGSPYTKDFPFKFTPKPLPGFDKNPLHKCLVCYGFDLKEEEAPKGLSLDYVIRFYKSYQKAGVADKFFSRPKWFDTLLGTPKVREQIMKGWSEEKIKETWKNELDKYKRIRDRYLIY